MSAKTIKLILIGVVTIIIFPFIFSPVPHKGVEYLTEVQAIPTRIHQSESGDIFFITEENTRYYINRAVDRGVTKDDFVSFIGKTLTFAYPEYFTLLDPSSRSRHTCVIKFGETTLFSEYK